MLAPSCNDRTDRSAIRPARVPRGAGAATPVRQVRWSLAGDCGTGRFFRQLHAGCRADHQQRRARLHRVAIAARRQSAPGDDAAQPASMAAVTAEDAGDAAGLCNVARNLGGSIGLALLSILIDRRNASVQPGVAMPCTVRHPNRAGGRDGPISGRSRASASLPRGELRPGRKPEPAHKKPLHRPTCAPSKEPATSQPYASADRTGRQSGRSAQCP